MRISQYSTSKKLAMLLTYGQIIVQSISTLLLTRFYILKLGEDAYGLYQMIYAVAQYILILDLGISTTMIRYIAEFDALDNHKKAENFAFHMMIIMAFIMCLIATIGFLMCSWLGNIYKTFTPEDLVVAQSVFKIMLLQIGLTIFSHFAQGIALAYNRYAFVKFVAIIQILLGAVLSVVFVMINMGIEGIVRANTIVIFTSAVIISLYDCIVLRFRVRFHELDLRMMRPAMILMIAMLLQSIIGYVNSSVDKTILGIMTTKHDVTVYSIAATIITMFNALPTAVSSVYQPDAVKIVVNGATPKELTDFISKPGRIQFIITGGFIAAWILMGRDFIKCWTGSSTIEAWGYVLIILVPNMIPLIQNTVLSVLNAKDKRIFRSIILGGMVVVNIVLTILFIKLLGPIGAPIATGLSYLMGHCIIMNIYYWKSLKINVFEMLKKTTSGIFTSTVLTFAICSPMLLWRIEESWLVFITKAIAFCIVYAFFLYRVGLNESEKNFVIGKIKGLKK